MWSLCPGKPGHCPITLISNHCTLCADPSSSELAFFHCCWGLLGWIFDRLLGVGEQAGGRHIVLFERPCNLTRFANSSLYKSSFPNAGGTKFKMSYSRFCFTSISFLISSALVGLRSYFDCRSCCCRCNFSHIYLRIDISFFHARSCGQLRRGTLYLCGNEVSSCDGKSKICHS